MTSKSKEILSGIQEVAAELTGETKQSLSILEKQTWIKFFKNASDWLINVFGLKGGNSKVSQKERIQQGGSNISERMLQELLNIEGSQNFVAKSHKNKFGESFVTGPYGMVYKHIDSKGNLLKSPIPFKEGERVEKQRAKDNARAYYNKKAEEWSNLLKNKGYKYTQDMLDALVSASGGTAASVKRLKNFVLSHWNNKEAIAKFISEFATTAAGSGKVMPGLVYRRKLEANWFQGIKRPISDYQRHLA